eukprot:4340990-Prymnesium_polylepis.1
MPTEAAARLARGSLDVDWAALSAKLPAGRSERDRQARKQLWKQIDFNGNGYCSLAEVDKGVRDVLELPDIAGAKPVLLRAFQASKGVATTRSKLGADYVEKGAEFRLLLANLRIYFELYAMFSRVDTSDE